MGKPLRETGSQSRDGSCKVAVVIPGLSMSGEQKAGGGERIAVRLANGLAAARNVQVDLVLFRPGGEFLTEVSRRVRVVPLGGRSWVSLLQRLRRYMDEEAPQCIFAQDNRASLLTLLARGLAGARSPVIVTIHGTLGWRWRQYPAPKRVLIWQVVRLIHRSADGVVAVSQAAAEDLFSLLRLSPKKVQVIYNPVVTAEMFQLARESVGTTCIRDIEAPFVLGVGRLVTEKGFDVLLRAFASVRRHRNIRLIILGDGPERSSLERLAERLGIAEHVWMPGFVKNPFPYLARASVFVLSSRWEGLPTVLIEAMALGTPVVSTDCPSGPAEILEHGRWGRLVPVDDPEALASAILRALDEPHAVPEAVWRRFTVEQSVGQYLRLMEKVCAGA